MMKYDLFAGETNNRLGDFEYAITELEKNVQITFDSEDVSVKDSNIEFTSEFNSELKNANASGEEFVADTDSTNDNENINTIMSVDLKNIIRQELASSVN